MTLALSDRIKQNQEPLTGDVDGEVVMVSMEKGSYYGLDQVGSRIWELITEPITPDELCDRLQQEYQVQRETCESDVLKFLDDLLEEGLIEVEK